jgi:L-threonylcarbamoyladenylate synthase
MGSDGHSDGVGRGPSGGQAQLRPADASRLEECLAAGGVAVFPTDTVYGLGCDPENRAAVERLYELKRRGADRPAAVMFFTLALALRALPEFQAGERAAIEALLPGALTLLLPNRARRFPLACGPDPDTVGLRVPLLERDLLSLREMGRPLLQSSANLSGAADAARVRDIPAELRLGADCVLDGGELAGASSTVLDLRDYERRGTWSVVREGAVSAPTLERALAALG